MSAQTNLVQLKLFFALIIGILIGFSLSELFKSSNCELNVTSTYLTEIDYQEDSRADLNKLTSTLAAAQSNSTYSDSAKPSLTDKLYNETRVLCWVLTSPKNHANRAKYLKQTWGTRCNKLIFMSSAEDGELGAINLNVTEGRQNLWNKTREAFKYIYEHHLDDADWFLKADDDTYVVMENLRAFLYQYSTDEPVYFGCKFRPLVRQGYMSGGASYVLSKEALKRFVERAYPNRLICHQRIGGSEDKEMGLCLQNVGVVAGDTRDTYKRHRFFPMAPQDFLIPKHKSNWYWKYIYYNTTDGLDCCSDYAISFHYIQPEFLYVFDYLIYRLRPFGINFNDRELPAKLNTTLLVQKWRQEMSDNPVFENSTKYK